MSTVSKSTTVQLNVGGTPYEISLSLIENFPDSMLACIISDKWKEGTEEKIFIERDGQRFRYVLDYMRDGEVTLPKGECVESFYKELDYFGIEYDSTKISSNDNLNLPETISFYKLFLEKYRTLEKEQGDEYKVTSITVDIINKALDQFNIDGPIDFLISYERKSNSIRTQQICQFLCEISTERQNEIVARINENILDLNLKVLRFNKITDHWHRFAIGAAS